MTTPAQTEATGGFAIRAYSAREEVIWPKYPKAGGFQTHPAHEATDDPRQSSRRNPSEGDQGTNRENARDFQQTRSKAGFGTPREHSDLRPTRRDKGSIIIAQ